MSTAGNMESSEQDTAFNYIRRRGRFTKAQAAALDALTEQYRWTPEDLDQRPLGMEIGFGMGFELLAQAQQEPHWRLLGVELYQPGIGSMLSRLQKLEIANVRLVDQPAQLLLQQVSALKACRRCVYSFPILGRKSAIISADSFSQIFWSNCIRRSTPGALCVWRRTGRLMANGW